MSAIHEHDIDVAAVAKLLRGWIASKNERAPTIDMDINLIDRWGPGLAGDGEFLLYIEEIGGKEISETLI